MTKKESKGFSLISSDVQLADALKTAATKRCEIDGAARTVCGRIVHLIYANKGDVVLCAQIYNGALKLLTAKECALKPHVGKIRLTLEEQGGIRKEEGQMIIDASKGAQHHAEAWFSNKENSVIGYSSAIRAAQSLDKKLKRIAEIKESGFEVAKADMIDFCNTNITRYEARSKSEAVTDKNEKAQYAVMADYFRKVLKLICKEDEKA